MDDGTNVCLPTNLFEESSEVMRRGFNDIQVELKAQGVLKKIRECDGTNVQKFKAWLKDLERAGEVMRADSVRMKTFALQRCGCRIL